MLFFAGSLTDSQGRSGTLSPRSSCSGTSGSILCPRPRLSTPRFLRASSFSEFSGLSRSSNGPSSASVFGPALPRRGDPERKLGGHRSGFSQPKLARRFCANTTRVKVCGLSPVIMGCPSGLHTRSARMSNVCVRNHYLSNDELRPRKSFCLQSITSSSLHTVSNAWFCIPASWRPPGALAWACNSRGQTWWLAFTVTTDDFFSGNPDRQLPAVVG
jgi:hypothetical protein